MKGPLNLARPPQGWPVIVQAGASELGRALAAETAEVVFSAHPSLAEGQRFYADVKGRMAAFGRARSALLVLPAAFVVVADTRSEARAKMAHLDSLVHPESGLASLSVALGHVDSRGVDLDGPLPPIPDTNASKGSRQKLLDIACERNLSVRELCQYVAGSYGSLEMIGTPRAIADQMEEWLDGAACDGFNVLFPYLPGGLDDFVEKVVPELQRRGLFRTEYAGPTLRENLGLARPKNRFFGG